MGAFAGEDVPEASAAFLFMELDRVSGAIPLACAAFGAAVWIWYSVGVVPCLLEEPKGADVGAESTPNTERGVDKDLSPWRGTGFRFVEVEHMLSPWRGVGVTPLTGI